MREIFRFAVVAGLWIAPLCVAQQPSDTLHASATIVQVPVLVTNASGELVHSLMAPDFIVTDDGVQQDVRVEPESAAPLSLVILMQTGGAAVHQFPRYVQLETMLEPILTPADGAPPNQVAVVAFDGRVEGATPFTSEIAEWRDAIDYPDVGDRDAAILDGLAYALDLLAKQPPANRRAILLISQPTDDGSKTSLKEILRTAEETNTAIFTLTFSPEKTAIKDAFHDDPHLNKPITVNPSAGATQGYFDLSAPLDLLIASMRKNVSAHLASLTGGETFPFATQKDLDEGLGTLANHIHNRYLLTFTPTSNHPGPHTLQVHLKGRTDLTIAARTSYWAP